MRTLTRPILIWAVLSAVHVALAIMSRVADSDALSAFIAGTIYLPLWPFHQCGVPVFERNQWMLPPPNILGWAIVVGVWTLVYGALAKFVSRLIRILSRPA